MAATEPPGSTPVRQPSAPPLNLEVSPDLVVLDTQTDGLRLLLIRTPKNSVSVAPRLSPREKEIARMIAKGLPNKAIAAVLDISIWTVSTHLRRMFGKYGVGSRAAMVARLIDEGLLV